MVEAVDTGHDRWINVLEAITLQNSGSRNLAGVKKVGDMVTPELEKLGFKVEKTRQLWKAGVAWIDGALESRREAA